MIGHENDRAYLSLSLHAVPSRDPLLWLEYIYSVLIERRTPLSLRSETHTDSRLLNVDLARCAAVRCVAREYGSPSWAPPPPPPSKLTKSRLPPPQAPSRTLLTRVREPGALAPRALRASHAPGRPRGSFTHRLPSRAGGPDSCSEGGGAGTGLRTASGDVLTARLTARPLPRPPSPRGTPGKTAGASRVTGGRKAARGRVRESAW